MSDGHPASGSMSGDTPSLVGQVLGGRYRLVKKLGEGGMGEVYAAEHVHIDKKFALKLLRPEIVSNKEAVSRFYQEARSSSSIGHRNIIGVEDFGELPDGRLYMCMELLNGAPLNDLITQPQPVERLLNIMIQTGHGLAAAHAKNIVHRDMKPENIYVTVGPNNEGDIPKLLDFGIAKVAGNDGQNNLTRTGTIFGTPFYMAPEQALGNPVDARTDIYAMGVIMYEVFAGSLPFQGESFMGILTQHITTDPEPVAQRAHKAGRPMPPGLAEVITRCMLKDPAQRFSSMDELVSALVHIYRGIAGAGMSTYMEAFPVAPSSSHPIAHAPPTGAHNMAKSPTMGVGGPPPGMHSPPHGMQTPPQGQNPYAVPSGGWQPPPPSGTGPVPASSGSGLYGSASSSSVVPQKKSSAGVIIAIVALLAVGGGIAAFVVMSNKSETNGSNDPGSGSQVASAGEAGVAVTIDAAGGTQTTPDAAVVTNNTVDAATTTNATPDAAAVETPVDASVATVAVDAGSETPVTPDAAVIAEPTTISVELVTASNIKFEIWENGTKVGEGPGTFEIPKGGKRKVTLKAKGFKDTTVTIDGKKKALAVSFAKIPTGGNTNNGNNNPPPPKCTGTAADMKSTAPKGCGALYCKTHSSDARCETYVP